MNIWIGNSINVKSVIAENFVCGTTANLSTLVCSPTVCGTTLVAGVTVCGTTVVRTPTVCGTTVVQTPTVCGTTIVCSPTVRASTIVCAPTITGATHCGVNYYGTCFHGTANNSACLGGQLPAYYAVATHGHGNITSGGCIGTVSGCLVSTSAGCLTTVSPSTITVGAATLATNACNICVFDTRAVTTTPETTNVGVRYDFKANATEGLSNGGTYFGEMTFRKYGSGTDWSGGAAHQLGFTDAGNIYHRIGTSTTWGSWNKLLSSADGFATLVCPAFACNISVAGAYTTITGIPATGNVDLVTQGAGVILKDETTANRWHLHYDEGKLTAYSGGTVEHIYVRTTDVVACATNSTCANNSACLGGQLPAYYAIATHGHGNITSGGCIGTVSGCLVNTSTNGCITTVSPSTITVGCATSATSANNSACLGGQLPAYYAVATHIHGNINNGGCIGTVRDHVLCTTTSGCITSIPASGITVGFACYSDCAGNACCFGGQLPSFYTSGGTHTHGNINFGGCIGTVSGCLVNTSTNGCITTVSPSTVTVGYATSATTALNATNVTCATYSRYLWLNGCVGTGYAEPRWTGSYWELTNNVGTGTYCVDYANCAGTVSYAATAGSATTATCAECAALLCNPFGNVCVKGHSSSTVSCAILYYCTAIRSYTLNTGMCIVGCGFATDFVASSDMRLKKCIKPISSALSMIGQLQGVCYELCDDCQNRNNVGFIAQDVEKVLPELVVHSESSDNDKKYGITGDRLGLKYDKLTAVLVEAIKEQQLQIELLRNELCAFKTKGV